VRSGYVAAKSAQSWLPWMAPSSARAFRNRPLRVYRTSVFEPVGRVVDHLLDLRNLLRLLLAQREPEVEGEVASYVGSSGFLCALCAGASLWKALLSAPSLTAAPRLRPGTPSPTLISC
jgi:hypothetical protein